MVVKKIYRLRNARRAFMLLRSANLLQNGTQSAASLIKFGCRDEKQPKSNRLYL